MAVPKARSQGCWTCQLRRKRCDEARPICESCSVLRIACHYADAKPEWMDGGAKQRAMTDDIKEQVKRNAWSRREMNAARLGTSQEADVQTEPFIIKSQLDFARAEPLTSQVDQIPQPLFAMLAMNSKYLGSPARMNAGLTLDFLDIAEDDDNPMPAIMRWDFEIDTLMRYLDHVFPFLFPFYQPSLFEVGRSWLLALFKQNRAAFHSAISMTSYFFTVAVVDAYGPLKNIYGSNMEPLQTNLWAKLESQSNSCFQMIHRDIADLSAGNKEFTPVAKLHVMESIIQFLWYEISLGRSADWIAHMHPAVALFKEFFANAPTTEGNPPLLSVLYALGSPSCARAQTGSHIWGLDQTGFRFFAGLLIYMDIIASTALQQPPQLSLYHDLVLADLDDGVAYLGTAPIKLSTIIGCQNWVLVAIGHISALAAWKHETFTATGHVPTADLEARAQLITADLEQGRLGFEQQEEQAAHTRTRGAVTFLSFAYPPSGHPGNITTAAAAAPSIASRTPTCIWLLAAQLYLFTTVAGWQLDSPDVREAVDRALDLLATVKVWAQLRTLAWPICVVGCLVVPGSGGNEEKRFADLFEGARAVDVVGALGEARKVVQRVWSERDAVITETPERFGLVDCMRVLGPPVLLI